MSLPYGFVLASDGSIVINQEKASVVRRIYQQYLSGMSLKGIADFLFAQGIPSPRDKAKWTQTVLSNLLSNQKYIGPIVSFDEYFMVQGEKDKRSNLDEYTRQRKTTRYSSQGVLSGLLICGECGRNYRRITRPPEKLSGAVPIGWSMGNNSANTRHPFQNSKLKIQYVQNSTWVLSMSR